MFKSTSGDFGPTVGAPVRFDQHAVALAAQQYATGRLLPAGQGASGIYKVGRYGLLVGRRVDEFTRGATAARSVHVDGADAFRAVDPARGTVPGLVTGALGAGTDAAVAVIVDGRIAGVSSTFADRGRDHSFAVIVPETFLTRGAHAVTVALVEGTPSAPTLRPVR